MPAKELDVSNHAKAHRDDALPSWPGASLVEQVPKPLPSEAEPNLSGRIQTAVARLGDVNRIKPTLAEFAEAGDREHADLGTFGLQPFPALAAPIPAAPPLRDDALGADLAHSLEQLFADTYDVIDINDPLATSRADDIPQQQLAVFDRTAPKIMVVEMQ